MFERFTDKARRVLVDAQESARLLGHSFIGSEHLALALLSSPELLGYRALTACGVDVDGARSRIEAAATARPSQTTTGSVPFTPRAKKILELSLREALQFGHNHIGSEHMVLALVREGQGVAARELDAAGAVDPLRREVARLVATEPESTAGTAPHRQWMTVGPTVMTTPAHARVQSAKLALAGTEPVGTHHALLALFTDPDSWAAQALAALGVTEAAVRQQLDDIPIAGTSDALPPGEETT